ncbi:MAG TPA: hypothetical protein VN180_00865, partial [Acidimicrobiia bacterium]|nr:hypothetical protein [Acidimicrobiia bacterium]
MRRGATGTVTGVAVAALALAMSACSSRAPATLDVPALQRLIARHARAAYPSLVVQTVRCAPGRARRPFTCRVATPAGPLALQVRYAAKGRLQVDAASAVVPASAAAAVVAAHTSIPGFVTCGPAPTVIAAPPDARLVCHVTFEDGTAQTVDLRVTDAAGTVQVETPSAVLATPAASPGGGGVTWTPIGRPVLGHPVTYGGSAGGVGLAWLDPRLLHPVLVSGTGDPPGGPGPWGGQVPPGARAGLAAAFNSGFKMGDIRGGWVGWGSVWRPPEDGDASLVVKKDGTATVGAWGRDVSLTPDVDYVRQNLTLLVDGGAPVAAASNPAAW